MLECGCFWAIQTPTGQPIQEAITQYKFETRRLESSVWAQTLLRKDQILCLLIIVKQNAINKTINLVTLCDLFFSQNIFSALNYCYKCLPPKTFVRHNIANPICINLYFIKIFKKRFVIIFLIFQMLYIFRICWKIYFPLMIL